MKLAEIEDQMLWRTMVVERAINAAMQYGSDENFSLIQWVQQQCQLALFCFAILIDFEIDFDEKDETGPWYIEEDSCEEFLGHRFLPIYKFIC